MLHFEIAVRMLRKRAFVFYVLDLVGVAGSIRILSCDAFEGYIHCGPQNYLNRQNKSSLLKMANPPNRVSRDHLSPPARPLHDRCSIGGRFCQCPNESIDHHMAEQCRLSTPQGN